MICSHGIDGYPFHSFEIIPLASLVFLWFYLLVPFELVVAEKGLVI